ncbi:MAG: DUF4380 domain-containing protein [Cytophagaceae bacterium]
MINLKNSILFLFLLTGFGCTKKEAETKIEEPAPADKGNGIYSFSTGNLTFEVDAKSGGRISAFKLDSSDFLSGKKINADNWGSTFWSSPQSAWGWPPSSEIDKLEYSGGIIDGSVVLTSKKDPKLGYVVQKQFMANAADTSVTICYTITNNSDSTRSASPWEITRVAPQGLTFFPTGKGEKKGKLAPLMKDSLGITWYVYDSSLVPAGHEKLMCDGAEGWMAQVNNGMIMIKKWDDVSLEQNAPGEGEVEIYANPDKSYIEIEPQGPYTELAPGKSLTWEVKWYLRPLPGGMKAEMGNKDLVDWVRGRVK